MASNEQRAVRVYCMGIRPITLLVIEDNDKWLIGTDAKDGTLRRVLQAAIRRQEEVNS
jgi:hypothetical protein